LQFAERLEVTITLRWDQWPAAQQGFEPRVYD